VNVLEIAALGLVGALIGGFALALVLAAIDGIREALHDNRGHPR